MAATDEFGIIHYNSSQMNNSKAFCEHLVRITL